MSWTDGRARHIGRLSTANSRVSVRQARDVRPVSLAEDGCRIRLQHAEAILRLLLARVYAPRTGHQRSELVVRRSPAAIQQRSRRVFSERMFSVGTGNMYELSRSALESNGRQRCVDEKRRSVLHEMS